MYLFFRFDMECGISYSTDQYYYYFELDCQSHQLNLGQIVDRLRSSFAVLYFPKVHDGNYNISQPNIIQDNVS